MKQLLLLLICFTISCKQNVETKTATTIKPVEAVVEVASNFPDLEIYDYQGLKPFLNKNDDKVHVVNFWATWCAPCIKELPYFEIINKNYASKNVEVLLVSLDFPRQYETKLKPFLKEKGIASKVICFDDVDQNTWIPAIAKDWSGALPATLIYSGDNREFYEGSFTLEELETKVKQFLN